MHSELVRSIGLSIRRILPVVACDLATVVAATGSSSELTKEKTILGFEEEELGRSDEVSKQEKPGRESWFYLLEQPEGFDFAARFEWPGATNRAWTWRCRRGPHTEGEMALATTDKIYIEGQCRLRRRGLRTADGNRDGHQGRISLRTHLCYHPL